MSRLPVVGSDNGTWGTVLNDYLTESATVAVLSSSPSAASTTFDVAVVPAGLQVGSTVAIDAFTTECELRSVAGISGNTITVAATRYAHATGDTLLALGDQTVTPPMYGMTNTTVDNWGPMQRLVNEAAALSLKIKFFAAVAGNVWAVSKPICVPTSAHWEHMGLKTHASYGPVDAAGALCMLSNRSWAFTATASNDTFTVAAGHGMSSYSADNHVKVVFNNPYGETLPGGITAGQVYYINTVPNSTTFTVSASVGGAILNVTSDGSGWAWESIEQLSRVYWDNVRFDLTVANVSGVRLNLQQPSYVRNLRVEMDANASAPDTTYGIVLGGQLSYLDNVSSNMSANCTGLVVSGTGLTIRGFNCNGVASGDTGIVVNGWNTAIHDPWTEQCGVAGIRLAAGRGVVIGGTWQHAGGGTSAPALLVDDLQISYEVCPIYFSSGTDRVVLVDSDRGLTLRTTGATDAASVVTDYYGTWAGWKQPGSALGQSIPNSPVFNARYTHGTGVDYTVRYADEFVAVSTAGGARVITLPSNSQDGWTYTVFHQLGANTCTLDTAGSETIDGSASITLVLGETVVLVALGGDYYTVGGHP